MKNKEIAIYLKDAFKNRSSISTTELSDAIAIALPEVSSSTISWRINQLKKENLIFQSGRGLYTFDFKPDYTPELSLKGKRLYNRIKPFCKSELSIWSTQMLNEIGGVNINRTWFFVSANKDDLDTLFENMLSYSKQIFLQPDKEIINRYLMAHKEAIILTPLVSGTPLSQITEYTTPTIEGLLVNAWLKNENYLKPIGFDIEYLFREALKNFSVNQSKLNRYSSRRDKSNEINEFIKTLS